MAAVTATGVPKPAAPSKKAPNEKAMNRSCRRRSSEMPRIERWRTSNSPFSLVSWYRKMTLTMIQPMGMSPKAAP